MKLDYKAFPIGACPACLQSWRDTGLPGQQQPLEGGGLLLTGYCTEREAGFYAIVEPDGIVNEWHIRVPIEIEHWRRYIEKLPLTYSGVLQAALDCGELPGAGPIDPRAN